MAELITLGESGVATPEQCRSGMSGPGFDPEESGSLENAARWLARLGNNRDFLGDILVDALAGTGAGTSDALAGLGGNAVMICPPGEGNFFIVAQIWPGIEDHAYRVSGPAPFDYDRAHDHTFDFLQLGYFGPGLEMEAWTYEAAQVEGHVGERVAITPAENLVLEPGMMVRYRAGRDIHRVQPPRSLAVTLALAHNHAVHGWLEHYQFEIADGSSAIIAARHGGGPSEAFLRIAVGLGGEEALDLAERFARHHPSDRMRLAAWRALVAQAPDDAARDALWAQAERGGSRLVARHAQAMRRSGR
ncbi:transposase [Novosphingobium sp. YJ-S2-02]|uniref:Transposase n=1 Tax=Novosphingobium aureum TaxID=2792964 RepID=A0A931H9Z3_9SPHN|nr:transposase [Novosphingobium aureum]MBH0111723.1 transposase [Novosphingobium aureum]